MMETPRRAGDFFSGTPPEQIKTADVAAWSADDRTRHLERVPLFNGCSESELRRIAEISTIAEVPAGTLVTEIGAPGDSFFFIIDGRVAVQTPVGLVTPLSPGDFFGEM